MATTHDIASRPVAPTRGTRWAGWLLVGALSAAIAETLAGSSPLVLFLPWAIVLTVPVYLLHTLVLGALVVRPGRRVTFGALYGAGLVFGLYEAYMTKVYWVVPWDAHPARVAGIALSAFLVVGVFWHPLLSFTAPLAVAERLTGGTAVQSALPRVVRDRMSRPRWVLGAAVVAGVVHGGMIHSPLIAAASIVTTLLALWLLVRWWRAQTGGRRVPLVDLLPRRSAWLALLALLLIDYALFGLSWRRQNVPPLRDQATIWALYAIFGTLWWRVARRAPRLMPADVADAPPPLALPPARRLIGAFSVASLVTATLTMTVGPVIAVPLWGFAIVVGVSAFVALVREAFGPRAPAPV